MPRIFQSLIALFALGLSAFSVSPAAAHYSEACWVKLRIEYPGASRYRSYYNSEIRPPIFAVTCNYVTGAELNTRAGFMRFADDRIYVVILWPRSEPSYIRISQSLPFCGDVAEPGCAERIAGRLTGHDLWYGRNGGLLRRTWDICQTGFIGRDCYRALGGTRR